MENTMRCAQLERNTAETQIQLSLSLDGSGKSEIKTGSGFLDHMLVLFAKHSRMDLSIACNGDVWVDLHHTTEDIGIALGQALKKALGDKRGICRYGEQLLPMDEALILCALDLCGRGQYHSDVTLPAQRVGDFDTELAEEFFSALSRESGMALHIRQLAGRNTHHILEGMFKALGRALRKAVAMDAQFADDVPSTKGVLE